MSLRVFEQQVQIAAGGPHGRKGDAAVATIRLWENLKTGEPARIEFEFNGRISTFV